MQLGLRKTLSGHGLLNRFPIAVSNHRIVLGFFRAHLTEEHLFRLLGKLGQDGFLGPAQHEGSQQPGQRPLHIARHAFGAREVQQARVGEL